MAFHPHSDADETFDYLFKIVLIGDADVGKTCVVQRFKSGTYVEKHASTIGVDFTMKTLQIDGKLVKNCKHHILNQTIMETKHSCSVCYETCRTECIFCENCEKWSHFRCQNVPKTERKEWSDPTLSFYCLYCRSTENNHFDYEKGLERLQKDSLVGYEKLKAGVRRENLFLKKVPLDCTVHTDFRTNAQDPVANAILSEYYATSKIALQSTGDGNCLFNAVSIVLTGNESRSTELRYRCCVEMVSNKDKMMRHRLARSISPISPDIEPDCLSCSTSGNWTSMWHILALSNLLDVKIDVVYPAVNGSQDYSFKNLNVVFRPPFVDPDKATISVMWTSILPPKKTRQTKRTVAWQPNHFVPLVKTTQKRQTVALETEESEFIADHMAPQSGEESMHKLHNLEAVGVSPLFHEDSSNQDELDEESLFQPDLSTIHEEIETTPSGSRPNGAEKIHTNESYSTDAGHCDFVRGPLTKFMDIKETVQTLQAPYTVLAEIPPGRKDGHYYIIENSSNVEKRQNGKRSEFWDDCGSWMNAATPCTLYIVRCGKLTNVVKRQGVYCILKQQNHKREFVRIHPQTSDDEVVAVCRLYQDLKEKSANGNMFRRRATWFEKSENVLPDISTSVAIIEYIGDFPGNGYHGAVKDTTSNQKYVRTKPAVRKKLSQQLANRSVKEVEREMNQTTSDDLEKQRNENQLRRIKNEATKDSQEKTTRNIADHIICVEEMAKEHEFVQSVKHIHGMQHPVVTLYTEQQINDIKRFCCREDGVVLGMDKTYNLGEFHVTPTVYKDLSVLRRSSNDHPICFGPTFIHQSSTTKVYSSFLHDIADNLTDQEISNLTVGSDEELAFKNAIKRCLTGCTHVLCTRHLKENTKRYLENIVGYPKNERDKILTAIYGERGLLEKTNSDTLEYRLSQLKQMITEKDSKAGEKKFMSYFQNKLVPVLTEHVMEPVNKGKINCLWTNNNCESANHVLKAAVQWKAQDMPKFINTLHGIVKGEQEERCRVIRDNGNYRLADRFLHHLTDISHWSTMSEENRQKRVKRFLTDSGKPNSNTVVSKDGTRTTQRTPSAGKIYNTNVKENEQKSRQPLIQKENFFHVSELKSVLLHSVHIVLKVPVEYLSVSDVANIH